ncbi:MAG: CGNR zinc finger domain-containing protein [Chloroflexi bacterium]|nr:CGNR zinc finger domain-containing protein [Chloroflexota bacterium]
MSHYVEHMIQFIVDFANTYDPYHAEPEFLRTPADLHDFLVNHQVQTIGEIGDQVLVEVRQLRNQVRGIFLRLEQGEAQEIARSINDLLVARPVEIQSVVDVDTGWHLEYEVLNPASVMVRLALRAGLGLTMAMQQYGAERLKICAASPCQEVFIDVSKNKSRRFCGDRCANRYNVAHFRERHRSDKD